MRSENTNGFAELYDKHNPSHIGRDIRKDTNDGKTYVLRSVEWFVRKVRETLVLSPTAR